MSLNRKNQNGRGSSSSSPIPRPKKNNISNKRGNQQIIINTNDEEIQNCSICQTEVDELSIQCDTCSFWTHQKCTSLTKSEFELLQMGNQHIVFHCTPCLQENTKNSNRIQKLEKEVGEHTKIINSMNDMMLLLRDQNKTLQQQNEMILQLVNSEKTKEQRLKAQIEEALDDYKEREEIQNNVLIFNVPEADAEDEEEDMKKLKDIMTIIEPTFNMECIKDKVSRLGKKKTDAKQARPIKITLPGHQKTKILRASKKLKESSKYNRVSMSHERTRKEREEYKKLKAILEEKNKDGNDYVIFDNEVVLRTTRDSKVSQKRTSQN